MNDMNYEKTILYKSIIGNKYNTNCMNCKKNITLFKFDIISYGYYMIVCNDCANMLYTLKI